MVWFMYQTHNAAFHSFLNNFQRDSGCLCENLRQTNKQKCFLWETLSNAKQQCWVSLGFSSNLLCFFFPKTRTMPAFSQQDLQHPPSGTCPLPSLSTRGSAELLATGWPGQLAVTPHRDLPVPLAESPASLTHPGSTASFPRNPSQPQTGSSTRGQDCIFRPTLRTSISILFCSQIYREHFDSNILLSLQAQNCVPAVA